MFNSQILIVFEVITTSVMFSRGEVTESTIVGIKSLFKEIGFSPACVSRTLALCENSPEGFSVLGIQNSIESLKQVQKHRPRNCADLLKNGDKESGLRTVYPFGCCENRPVSVLCDQTTDGGGWTLIQHREDLPRREDFFRNWKEYQLGFGDIAAEFWLGLDKIHALVSDTLMELRVDLEDFEGQKRWAKYDYFYIGDAAGKYSLELGKYSGDAGDSLTGHSGQKFSTKDEDNDTNPSGSCAKSHKGAWWYTKCHSSNLNGYQYEGHHDSYADGINWKAFRGYNHSMKLTSLSLRPKYPGYADS